jgi:ligand-binding sensor protein
VIISNEIKHLKRLTKLLSSSPIVKANEELQQKLLMLLNPPGEIKSLKLINIIDLDLLQLLQDKFSDAYGVSSVICDQEGVAITKPNNFSKFCELARTSPDGLKLCRESRKKFLKANLYDSLSPLTGCKNFPKLLGTCVPFKVDGYCAGVWCVGQMVVKPFDENIVRGYAKELSVDADKLFEYSKELRVETIENYKRLITFLESMCKILSVLGLQNIRQAQEINKRVKIEKEVVKANRMVRRMCDNLPEMIWCKDLDKKYMFANKAVCENLLFTTTEEVVGKDDIFFASRERTLDPGNDKFHTFGVICHKSDQKVLTSGKTIHLEEEGYLKGKKVILEITKSPFFDENGRLIGVVGSGKFVTER